MQQTEFFRRLPHIEQPHRRLHSLAVFFAFGCCLLNAQTPETAHAPADAKQPATTQAATSPETDKQASDKQVKKLPRASDRRHATKLYFAAGKLFIAEKFEEAMTMYGDAARLDPTNADYRVAASVARAHAVTALVQSAAQWRLKGNAQAARVALSSALALDPESPIVAQHLDELGAESVATNSIPGQRPLDLPVEPGEGAELEPTLTPRSFHLNTDTRQVVQQVFRGYDIEVTFDDSVRRDRVRFEIDNASYADASTALALLTKTFFVPLDAHRVLVARDTREMRQQYTRLELETVSLSGLSANEMSDMANLAKSVFGVQTASANASTGTLTIRASAVSLDAFNRTLRDLVSGRSQILLDVSMIQLAHSRERQSGIQPQQSMTAFNVYAEEQSILNSNSTAVQEIISSGLASANEPLAILGILIASGSVSSSLFSNGIATFGGGITESGLSPGSASIKMAINTSESRQLDHVQLRVADGDDQGSTLRLGSRYPIQTSSYSSLTSSSTIAGVTTSGTSSALSSLLSSSGSSYTTPMVQYEDLGFTLKAKAAVMRNGRVALNLGIKIDALSGSSLSGNPILNSRRYEGDVQVEEGAAVVVASELDRSETHAVSGTPGLDEIPGLSQTDSHDKQGSGSTLLIVVTPRVVRGTQDAGRSSILRIDRSAAQSD